MRILAGLFVILLINTISAQPQNRDIDRVMAEINKLRASGCKCGGQRMRAVGPVSWNQDLYRVSKKYAAYLQRNNHFDHISLEGEYLGDRLDKIGYDWQKVGENLGYGYDHFYEVFEAWQESPSHCRMLMDPDVTFMGLSKKGTYWVQSFSRPMETIYVQADGRTYD
ncbi:MAG: hypothetical protein ACI9FN_001255 [Saprospiraceae bacterium]|jgi:uncharacterized protein YkwD